MTGYQMIRSTVKMLSENYASIIHQSILQEHPYATRRKKPKVQISYHCFHSLSWGIMLARIKTPMLCRLYFPPVVLSTMLHHERLAIRTWPDQTVQRKTCTCLNYFSWNQAKHTRNMHKWSNLLRYATYIGNSCYVPTCDHFVLWIESHALTHQFLQFAPARMFFPLAHGWNWN